MGPHKPRAPENRPDRIPQHRINRASEIDKTARVSILKPGAERMQKLEEKDHI
jgi:hypothetical protein